MYYYKTDSSPMAIDQSPQSPTQSCLKPSLIKAMFHSGHSGSAGPHNNQGQAYSSGPLILCEKKGAIQAADSPLLSPHYWIHFSG